MRSSLAPAAMILALSLVGGAGCAKGLPVPGPTATISIPAGSFDLGTVATACATSGCTGERGVRPVRLTRAFEIEQTEVTRQQMAACAAFGGCCDEGEFEPDQSDPLQPAFVTVDQARAYCRWRNRRLPTEAEWEVAARAKDDKGSLQAFPWSAAPSACAVPSSECPGSRPTEVGTNPLDRTPLGVQDMGGNVSEWVDDDYTIAIGCRHQLAVSSLCPGGSGDLECVQRICGTDGKSCLGGCWNNSSVANGLSCSSVGAQSDSARYCPVSTEPAIDPLHVTFDHALATATCGNSYSGSSSGQPGTPTPMFKGGGVDQPSCMQDPGMRARAVDGTPPLGPISGDGSDRRPRHGFRCAVGAAVEPTLTARFSLQRWPHCGPVEVAYGSGGAAPAGWGGRMTLAIETNRGWAAAAFNASRGVYEIDLGKVCTDTGQDVISRALLVVQGVSQARFTLKLTYDTLDPCHATATATVDLTSGERACADEQPVDSGSCQ